MRLGERERADQCNNSVSISISVEWECAPYLFTFAFMDFGPNWIWRRWSRMKKALRGGYQLRFHGVFRPPKSIYARLRAKTRREAGVEEPIKRDELIFKCTLRFIIYYCWKASAHSSSACRDSDQIIVNINQAMNWTNKKKNIEIMRRWSSVHSNQNIKLK